MGQGNRFRCYSHFFNLLLYFFQCPENKDGGEVMNFQTEISEEDWEKVSRQAYYLTLLLAILFAIVMAVVEN
jgi:hypothetical protein